MTILRAARCWKRYIPPWVTVISSDTLRADSGLPVFLAQGEFAPDASLKVLSLDQASTLPQNPPPAEAWRVTVTGLKTSDTPVTLRLLTPDRTKEYEVYSLKDGRYEKLSCAQDGSCLIFPASGAVTEVILSEKTGKGAALLLWLLLPAALLAAIAVLLLRRRKTSFPRKDRKKRHTVEESPQSPDNG